VWSKPKQWSQVPMLSAESALRNNLQGHVEITDTGGATLSWINPPEEYCADTRGGMTPGSTPTTGLSTAITFLVCVKDSPTLLAVPRTTLAERVHLGIMPSDSRELLWL